VSSTHRERSERVVVDEVGFPRLGAALRDAWREGYAADDARADVLAGLTVGVVALPLSMALAIASGVAPQHGLITAVVAGFVIALLGGSRTQVSGPTAAFVVLLVPISARYGLGGLALASAMSGLLLVVLGAFRLGAWLRYVPFPVTTGFTAGIAVVIATLQVKDALGLTLDAAPEHMGDRLAALSRALPTARPADVGVAALTFCVLLIAPRVTRRVPAPLIALVVASLAALGLRAVVDGFEVATIGSRFSTVVDGALVHGVPRAPPMPVWPWMLHDASGAPIGLSLALLKELFPSACALAALGAIESLLSASVADGMTKTRTDPNGELVAQGIGNLVAPFFGGFVATGAIARTATNVRAGARSPIAAMVHAVVVLLSVLLFAPLLAHVPMASLAALLLMVAWNMSEARHVVHTLRTAPRSDALVLVVCLVLTVAFDMVVAVGVGVVLASLLFMRRMAELTGVDVVDDERPTEGRELPFGVARYVISGPLFFGAAERAMRVLDAVSSSVRVVHFDLSRVPVMDATGLVAFTSAIERLRARGVTPFVVGAPQETRDTLVRAGVRAELVATDEEALARAREDTRPAT